MRVEGINKVNQVYQTNKVNLINQHQKAYGRDAVEFSSQAKDAQVVKKALNACSDIRLDKVEEIKRRMEQGTYQVSNKEIADKLVESLFDAKI